jgi:hypothetical protein
MGHVIGLKPAPLTHGEMVSGSHFTGGCLEFRAGMSSGKRKILNAWRKKNDILSAF